MIPLRSGWKFGWEPTSVALLKKPRSPPLSSPKGRQRGSDVGGPP